MKTNPNGRKFVSETAFIENREGQMEVVPQILEQLRNLNVTAENELKLEYFFYTNKVEKAKQLATEIEKLNYTVEYDIAAGDNKSFVVTGWTTKMKMADEIVQQWTKQMCELGYKFDCDFDGWGTTPDQE